MAGNPPGRVRMTPERWQQIKGVLDQAPLRTVEVTMIGHDVRLSTIPWSTLTFLDDLDSRKECSADHP